MDLRLYSPIQYQLTCDLCLTLIDLLLLVFTNEAGPGLRACCDCWNKIAALLISRLRLDELGCCCANGAELLRVRRVSHCEITGLSVADQF